MSTSSVDSSSGRCSTIFMEGVQPAQAWISEAVAEKLDVDQFLAVSNTINIAELGCLVGFIAVENIVESVKRKYQSKNLKPEEIQFQVFVNDLSSKDFNTLFKSLGSKKQYFAAGVPGPIHGRLFPKASLHFVNSAYALHWLSKVPDEVADKQSPAFNKGRIHYTNAPGEVIEAYADQFARDIEAFLNARSEELIPGGLMALVIPCVPSDNSPCPSPLVGPVDLLGDCLMSMAELGSVSEEKVDSFNFPKYNPSVKELQELIRRNGRFSIERMERLIRPTGTDKFPSIHIFMLSLRASWEGMIKEHFGDEILDELFDLLRKKIVTTSALSEAAIEAVVECFILLQRKPV